MRPRSEQQTSRRPPDPVLSAPEVHVAHTATNSSDPLDGRGRKGVLLEPVLGEDSTADASRDRAGPARCKQPPCWPLLCIRLKAVRVVAIFLFVSLSEYMCKTRLLAARACAGGADGTFFSFFVIASFSSRKCTGSLAGRISFNVCSCLSGGRAGGGPRGGCARGPERTDCEGREDQHSFHLPHVS